MRLRACIGTYRRLLELLAEAGDSVADPIPVAVETARGLLVSCLRTTGRRVYSINPMAVARYRVVKIRPRRAASLRALQSGSAGDHRRDIGQAPA